MGEKKKLSSMHLNDDKGVGEDTTMLSCLLAVTELEDELDVLGPGPGTHNQPPQLRENQSPANERAGFLFLPANREPMSCLTPSLT